MRDDGPIVRDITAAVYVIPTDTPEADGVVWDQTTMVLASARAGTARGIGWSYAAAAARSVIADVIAATAISAVDIALWDLKARLLGSSVIQLLGLARDRVPVYGSGGFTSYDDDQTREQLAGVASSPPPLPRKGPMKQTVG